MPANPFKEVSLEEIKKEMVALSDEIFANPEVSGAEYSSKKAHVKLLEKHHFAIREFDLPQLETAFIATFDSGKPGPVIAYLAEYDALPEIGHACGHNLLGAVSTGAAVLLSKLLPSVGGKTLLIGTPAEETYGGKILMVDAGLFEGVDISMIAHPDSENRVSGESLACHEVELEFRGKASHAAAAPDKGKNALSAMMLTFMGINAMREHFTDDVRVHGIITNGGAAANIIPDFTKATFHVRAASRKTADEARERFFDIVKGAELMTGAVASLDCLGRPYDNMNTNRVLSDICTACMESAGMTDISRDTVSKVSIDMGNVSHAVPAIHPFFNITDESAPELHTLAFAACTKTPFAYEQMFKMAQALALTGYKVASDPALLAEIKEEFKKS
ncbi:MAG: M20 family metallopeptidase [Clostridiales Family XIII bacterium]|jgi:amidohydrolase|nr:M20 family metallopeptidase [Clostridiales Family XIII bacterium]